MAIDRTRIRDANYLSVGDSDDGKFYHDGTDTHLTNATGVFYFTSTATGEKMIFTADSVQLVTLDPALGNGVVWLVDDTTGFEFRQSGTGINSLDSTSSDGEFKIRNRTASGTITVQCTNSASVLTTYFDVNCDTGMNIGLTAAHKIGFFGATPTVQSAKASYNNWAALSDVVQALVDRGLFDAV